VEELERERSAVEEVRKRFSGFIAEALEQLDARRRRPRDRERSPTRG
jgi:hypothetical protein